MRKKGNDADEKNKPRAPKAPRDSPLFTKKEQDLLNKLTKFVFANTDTFSKRWKVAVKIYGFTESCETVKACY